MMTPAAIEFEPLSDSEEGAAMVKIRLLSGEIRGVQIGKLWRLRVSSLNAWLPQK
jgi:hypothetical protein